ncbi:MAG TPA: SIS domain-containing protein [Albitalea sp.]|nr:SIS domain-containing protein [Albitalea sp.]
MLEARIQQQFFECADLMYQVADGVSRPVADASQAIVGCLTAGGKLLACGHGGGQLLAQWLVSALMLRFERQRPPLAALALGPGLALPLGPHDELNAEPHLALALQLRALGQPGDLLLACCAAGDDPAMLAVVREAHAKDMSVVLLGGATTEAAALPGLLGETDVWIAVPHERLARVHELHLLVLHALCDAIDLQLLGDAEPA